MSISTPLTSRARKHRVVIQCVTRTTAECREVTVAAGTTEPEAAAQTEPTIPQSVSISAHVLHAICTLVENLQRNDHEDRGLVVNARYFAQHRLLVFLKVARRVQSDVDVGKLSVDQRIYPLCADSGIQ